MLEFRNMNIGIFGLCNYFVGIFCIIHAMKEDKHLFSILGYIDRNITATQPLQTNKPLQTKPRKGYNGEELIRLRYCALDSKEDHLEESEVEEQGLKSELNRTILTP